MVFPLEKGLGMTRMSLYKRTKGMTNLEDKSILVGWKEIGAALGIGWRQAIRYYTEKGLPVGIIGYRAKAFRHHLEAWLLDQRGSPRPGRWSKKRVSRQVLTS